MRSLKEVQGAETEYFEKVWLIRHFEAAEILKFDSVKLKKEVEKEAQRLIEKYGKVVPNPPSGYDMGILDGKLSALRWVLGGDWDMFDGC